jgi:hypothetical protein
VTIRDGLTVLGTVKADSSGAWSFTTGTLAEGAHSLTATAIDTAGNSSPVSAALSVMIDTTAAAPTLSLATASDTGTSASDNLTADATPTLTGTAEAGATVTIRDGSTVLGTATADSSGAWSFTTGTLSEGAHSLTATATDKAGNVSSASATVSLTVDASITAPTINLATASDTGASSTDQITADLTPTLTGTAEAGATVTIRDGSTVLGTVTADSSGAWSFTTGTLSEGAHSLTAIATDKAGNVSSASATVSLIVDASAAAPTINLATASDTGTSSSDQITSDLTPTLTGTAEAGATVTIRDGSTVLGTVTADSSGAWSFTTGTLAEGAHSFTAVQTDAAGNTSPVSAGLAVTVETIAPGTPTIALDAASDTGPSNADGITADTTPTLTGTAEAGATVTIRDGSTVLGTVKADSSGAWSFTTDTLDVGNYSFTAIAMDAAGNTSPASATLAVIIKATVYDLSTLLPSEGFIIQGDADMDQAGWSVSSAGDVNGDGFDDVIIGAPTGGDGGTLAGEAYVVFGSASGFGTIDSNGRQVVDLTTLTASQGFIIQGDTSFDRAGFSVSSAGDVNGDGFDDLVIGAPVGGDGGNRAGEAYVVFGSSSGFGTADSDGRQVIDLTTLTASQGFIIQGDVANDSAGWSVSSAGDVNGDGFDDLIIGAPGGGGSIAGEAFVVFGSASGFGTADGDGRQVIDLTTLTASQGFIIHGDMNKMMTANSVSSAGDVNGDGFDDLIMSASSGYAGEAHVVFGSASGFGTTDSSGRQVIDLTTLPATEGFMIQGAQDGDVFGWSVSSAGDVNGDGFDDLIVGRKYGYDGGAGAGEAYVVFGSSSGFGTTDSSGRQVVNLTTLTASHGFIIQGDTSYDRAGSSVSSAGDVNGDGFDDLIVGAKGGDDGGSYAGEAYVIFGSSSGFGHADSSGRQVIDLTTLATAQGFIIQGDTNYDGAGYSVSSAGDVNGDGFDDLMVGAPFGDDGGTNAGEAYILYGSAFGASERGRMLTGSASADILTGGVGKDVLYGNGGADVLSGGNGDDILFVADASFRRVSGGGGVDTLAFSGAGLDIDFTTIANSRVKSIERLDLTGTGDNSATLNASDLFHFSSTFDRNFAAATLDEALVVDGNGGDALTLAAGGGTWSLTGQDVGLDGSAGGDYDIYTYEISGHARGFIAVDAEVTVSLL